MVRRAKDCHIEVIISTLKGVIKRPLKDNTCSTIVYWFYGPCITCAIKLPPYAINVDISCFGPYLYSESLSGRRFSSVLSLIIGQLMTLNRQEYMPLSVVTVNAFGDYLCDVAWLSLYNSLLFPLIFIECDSV